MIINTEGDFIAPWHLAPKELVKEQGAREQWIYLTNTQFSCLKMLGKPTNSKQSTNTGYKLTYSSHLSTAIAWREKNCKHFVFYKYFSLVPEFQKKQSSHF
jgi:hypothetical protein